MASTLFRTLHRWKCTSTHHKLALDALTLLKNPGAEGWQAVFLARIEPYLTGSKAPDTQFKDFRNHVYHVKENGWGGAPGAAVSWYAKTVTSLKDRRWNEAVYHAGVLSHYVTDIVQPFHTGQSEAEGAVHRAAEWSIACGYFELRDLLVGELGGFPELPRLTGPNWLVESMERAATTASPHYEPLIDHYNLSIGKSRPVDGMDDEFRRRIALLIGYAAALFAQVLDRAIEEAAVDPPRQGTALLGLLAQATIPLFAVTQSRFQSKERAVVKKIAKEFEATGKVVKNLPLDEKTVRAAHAEDVLKTTLEDLDAQPARPPGTKYVDPRQNAADDEKARPSPPVKKETAPPSRPANGPLLSREMPIERAPSIGPKTARRLETLRLKTVGDLLDADPDELDAALKKQGFSGEMLWTWQLQANLCCDVAGLYGHDAQLLVAAGISEATELAAANPEELLGRVTGISRSTAGKQILREGKPPDLAEVTGWIANARQGSNRRAA
ncbi:MAG: DUF4332 domain-containing protein [Planctomycetaceae bacterium]|nr:DUF4332 domain-containing protein [Planctomycetaceae bacterium]